MKHRLLIRSTLATLALMLAAVGTPLAEPAGATVASPTGPHQGTPPGARHRGEAAVEALGARRPEVAARMGITQFELRDLLLTDTTHFVDDEGQLGVTEALPAEQALSSSSAASWTTTPPFDTTTTFTLHSNPSSTRKIYLDFNGHTMTGTWWNQAVGSSTITLAPFNTSGTGSSYSTTEHAAIQEAYLSVREDFSMFDVDVTTQDPGVAGLTRSTSSDTSYGIRVVITPTNFEGCSCGGAAYYGTFGASTDTPAYVLLSATKPMAEAISHETGHTLNLAHDGTPTTTYYAGHGDWAPIMGNSYSRRITQWSTGEYPNSNNSQNDIAVMGTSGLPTLTADVGGTLATAYTVTLGTKIGASRIHFAGDVDAYKFNVPATRTVNLVAENWFGTVVDTNLNMRLRLYNGSGTLLQTASPTATTGATLSRSVGAGTYYVLIDGVGEGDPGTTGYSNYGSLGRYNLAIG